MPTPRFEALVERVVLVVLDGLRPDAIGRFELETLQQLAENGASTIRASTVTPSVTACAMASLITGAMPARHGFTSDRFGIPRPKGVIHPLPRMLATHGLPTAAFLARVPFLMRPVAQRIASVAGVSQVRFHGECADDIVTSARDTLVSQHEGLILMHWPDGDRAGHEHGWMSEQYGRAVQNMDRALKRAIELLECSKGNTLLIAMADHGGGGCNVRDHNSAHPLDHTIPVIMAGGTVATGDLGENVSLTDVPATILHALGVKQPDSYAGRPLLHAFHANALVR